MRNYGLQEIIESVQDYILGASKVPFIPYNPSGNWEPFLPAFERQTTDARQETSACTVFGSLSQIETLYTLLYNTEPNYSERFVYLNVPINPSKGTDPQNTYEAIRAHGLVNESLVPMTRTIEEYLDTSDITGSIRARGKNWLVQHDFKHEWLWETNKRPQNYIEVLKEALQTSPLGVSVSAWNEVNGEYISKGKVNNHFCLLYKIDDEGHPWIFDSYDNSKKKLSKDHNIRRAKRIWINKRTVPAMKKHISILTIILNRLMSKKTFIEVCEEAIGTDVTPRDVVNDEVACAETVSTLIKKMEPAFPLITGTASLWEYLDNPIHGFVEVKEPSAGCIIISPTGYGDKGAIGHVGVVLEDDLIASNTSFGIHAGKFMRNHTLKTWRDYYTGRYHFPVYFYKKIS